ncbi:MAG: Asp-tRNA(Asn)/Glu-tRNA(Gln) amidotransferase subunit GatC [Bacilli bacterium]|nr:Asp-tRNA(Asn)/Glu-tRNA(Gln) amidotransferase subunit GatC [Bacilli bacterium]
MSRFTKEMVNELADKLLFDLSEEENQMVLDEFEEIDRNMNKINKIADIEKVDVMTHPFEIEFSISDLREDDNIEELSQEDVLQNAGHKNLTSIIVPKVVGE